MEDGRQQYFPVYCGISNAEGYHHDSFCTQFHEVKHMSQTSFADICEIETLIL